MMRHASVVTIAWARLSKAVHEAPNLAHEPLGLPNGFWLKIFSTRPAYTITRPHTTPSWQ